MNRTERLHAIQCELQRVAPRGRTSAWLAERFGVSVRTIKRDMRALYEADVGLIADEGRGGGYSLDRARALPALTFTPGEATAIAVAIGAAPDLPLRADARSALAKLLGAMQPTQRAHAQQLASRLWVREGTPRSRWAAVIDEALRQRRVIHLTYADASGTQTQRAVEPMALARLRHHWCLLGWCRSRSAGRWFRTDRVVAAYLTREQAPPRDLAETFGQPPPDAHPVSIEG